MNNKNKGMDKGIKVDPKDPFVQYISRLTDPDAKALKRKKKETIAQRVEMLEAVACDRLDDIIELEARLDKLIAANEISHVAFARRLGDLERLVQQPTLYVNPWEPKPSRLYRFWKATKRFFGFGART